MTYYSGKEMARRFEPFARTRSRSRKRFRRTSTTSKAAPDVRSVGQTLAHVALSTGFQHHIHTNKIDDMKTVNFGELMAKFGPEEAKPRTKAEIVALLKSEGEKFAAYLDGVSDSFLAESVTMPPGTVPQRRRRASRCCSRRRNTRCTTAAS